MILAELEELLTKLSPAEKAEVLQRLLPGIAHVWPGVEKTSGICGGAACIVRTRIPVWSLEGYRRLGWSEASILENFPALRAADLVNAWACADAHRSEIDREIRENDAA